jgi:hypothetical protein
LYCGGDVAKGRGERSLCRLVAPAKGRERGICLFVRALFRGGQRPVAIPSSVRPPHQSRSAREEA